MPNTVNEMISAAGRWLPVKYAGFLYRASYFISCFMFLVHPFGSDDFGTRPACGLLMI
jgi:hypothetical protein